MSPDGRSPSTPLAEAVAAAESPVGGDESRFYRLAVLLLCAAWLGVSMFFAWQITAVGVMTWDSAFILSLLDWGPWMLLTPVVFWLARKLPIAARSALWAVPAHLILSVVLVAGVEAGMSSVGLDRETLALRPGGPRGGDRMQVPTPEERKRFEQQMRDRPEPFRDPVQFAWFRFMDRARLAVPVYWMLLAAAHAFAYQRHSQARERRALRAEALLAESRLLALQAQLNPHFLFNTLNTISHLVFTQPEAAEDMIASLSDLLRAVLAVQHRPEVSLREELLFVEHYASIQKLRFSGRLEVSLDIQPVALEAKLPTLLLQPLVENAVIHGVAPEEQAGRIFVRARLHGARLLLEVADTGHRDTNAPDEAGREPAEPGAPVSFREGIGLSNTRARLVALYGTDHAFELRRAAEGGISVVIDIPRERTVS